MNFKTTPKIGLFFDATEGGGFGHLARARALSVAMGTGDVRLVHLSRRGSKGLQVKELCPDHSVDTRMLEGGAVETVMADYSMIVVDSYLDEIQSFGWAPPLFASSPEIHVVLIIDSLWAALPGALRAWRKHFYAILDATHALDGTAAADPALRRAGPEAVFLNFDVVRPDCAKGETWRFPLLHAGCPQLPFCLALGQSTEAIKAEHAITKHFESSGRTLTKIQRGSTFGHLRLEGMSSKEYASGQVFAHCSDLVTAAGQQLWEAACSRKDFWVVALSSLHKGLMDRLFHHGILSVEEKLTTKGWPLWRVSVPERTSQILREHRTRGLALAKGIDA